MEYEIATDHLEAQTIVSIREWHARPELPGFIQAGMRGLLGRLRVLGVGLAGPPFVVYHEFAADLVDVEVCVPVARTMWATGRIQSRTMPSMTVARTLHVGPYGAPGLAYAALSDWIATNGYEVAGPFQERYLDGPGEGVMPSGNRTEIEMPVVPVGIAVAV